MLLEERLPVSTSDGVTLELRVAGPAARSIAAVIDHLIAAVVVLVAAQVARSVDRSFPIVVALIAPVGIAVLAGLEIAGAGRSPGKRAVGLRVTRADGTPAGVGALLVRNVLRLVDVLPATLGFPVPYGLGLVTSVASERRQRLGDHAAGTVVVWDQVMAFGLVGRIDWSRLPVFDATPGDLAERPTVWLHRGYDPPAMRPLAGPHPGMVWRPSTVAPEVTTGSWDVRWVEARDIAIARRYVSRRPALTPAARLFLAEQLHRRLAPQVVGAPDDVPPEAFVEHVVALRSSVGRTPIQLGGPAPPAPPPPLAPPTTAALYPSP